VAETQISRRRMVLEVVVDIATLLMGLSFTIPFVYVGGVALGFSQPVIVIHAIVCCYLLFAAGGRIADRTYLGRHR